MSDSQHAVQVSGLYKEFMLPTQQVRSVKSIITDFRSYRKRSFSRQKALQDISFDVKKGEFFGIVGRNGSGKSTLLKVIAGIYQPSKGRIKAEGKVVPFIELGVGFNPELSGEDNVYLNGAMLGFSTKQVREKYTSIVDFAELEGFMGQKLKNYSSGMQVRLAFSVATMLAESDILLLDEVLAVGDADFQRKCFDYFKNLKKQKKTVIFVSHDMNAVREYCDRAVLIENSRVVASGKASDIAEKYTKLFLETTHKNETGGEDNNRWGDKKITIQSINLDKSKLTDKEKTVTFTIVAKANEEIDNPIFGFLIKGATGQHILGTNSMILKQKFEKMKKDETVKLIWEVPNVFNEGLHYIDPAIVYDQGVSVADWWEEAAVFRVLRESKTPYLVNPPISLELKNNN